MPSDIGIVKEITVGFGEYLDGLGVGVWSSGSIPTDQTAIVLGPIPQEFDNAIGLQPGIVSSERQVGVGVLRMQVYTRAPSPAALLDLRGAVKEAVDGKRYVNAGGHVLPLVWYSSGVDLSEDHGRSFEASDNYYMHYSQPER